MLFIGIALLVVGFFAGGVIQRFKTWPWKR